MVESFFAWRARRSGVRWYRGELRPAPALESTEDRLSTDQERWLDQLSKEMDKESRLLRKLPVVEGYEPFRHVPPPPPARPQEGAFWAAIVVMSVGGVAAMFGAVMAFAQGAMFDGVLCLVVGALCAYVLSPGKR